MEGLLGDFGMKVHELKELLNALPDECNEQDVVLYADHGQSFEDVTEIFHANLVGGLYRGQERTFIDDEDLDAFGGDGYSRVIVVG